MAKAKKPVVKKPQVKSTPVPPSPFDEEDTPVQLKAKVTVKPDFDFEGQDNTALEAIISKALAALKKIDTTMNDSLRRKLVQRITQDLDDSEKCTPGLYQAALRLVGEELGGVDMEGTITGMRVKELEAKLPKFD
jgi:hypothetical protein